MDTSQYDSRTRRVLKRYMRHPAIQALEAKRKEQVAALEAKLTERNKKIDELTKQIGEKK